MASSPITSWKIDGKTVTDFIFLVSKITADCDCSHEIKRYLVLGRKAMTNLDSILKSREIILPIQVHVVKAIVFPAVMYGCEIWTIKKAEHQKTDAFKYDVGEDSWESLGLQGDQTSQSILQENYLEYSLEGMILKLKLQYFGHLRQRAGSLEKTLMLGKVEAGGERDHRGWDGWMAPPTQWTWVWANSRRQWRTRKPGVLQCIGPQRVRHDWATEKQRMRSINNLQSSIDTCWLEVARKENHGHLLMFVMSYRGKNSCATIIPKI